MTATQGLPDDAPLSRLAEQILEACGDKITAVAGMRADQAERLLEIARGERKPKAVDIEAILEEEGSLT